MKFYKSKDLKLGLRIILKNKPYIILENKFFNFGRGKAFNKLKIRGILDKKIIKIKLRAGEGLEIANIYYYKSKYLYKEKNIYYFMNSDSCEYYEINSYIIGDMYKWIKIGSFYNIVLKNNIPLLIDVPKFVILKVLSLDSGSKKYNSLKNMDYFLVETGAVLKLPSFIKENDNVKINTETEEYVSR